MSVHNLAYVATVFSYRLLLFYNNLQTCSIVHTRLLATTLLLRRVKLLMGFLGNSLGNQEESARRQKQFAIKAKKRQI